MTKRGAMVPRRLKVAFELIWTGHAPAVVATLAGTIAIGAAPVLTAWLTKRLIDLLVLRQDVSTGMVTGIVVGLVVTTAAQQLGQDWVRYLEAQLGRRVEYITQARIFAKINSFPGLSWFENPRAHDQIRLAQETSRQAALLISVVTAVIQHLATLAGFIVAILATGPLLAPLLLAAAIPQLVAQLQLASRQVSLRRSLSPSERRQLFYAELQADPRAAKELRLFGLGRFFHGRMLDEAHRIHRAEQRLDRRVLRVDALFGALSAVLSAVALGMVARAALRGEITPGDVALFLAALAAMTGGLAQLVDQVARAREAIGMVGYYDDLMSIRDENPSLAAARTAPPLRAGIVLEDVWFRYADDLPWVLRGVCLRIPAGASVGLVGRNGAGKSTIVKLLGRLYEPTKGRIHWDGIDLREITHESLRDRIGMVFQDYMSYDMTAAENIGVGDLERLRDRTRIRSAAELAGLAEAIEALPNGYATMLSKIHFVGEDDQRTGILLSGGQWQRLALARMLMRSDRDMLILDEPSAGLDAEAESQVNQIVLKETAGRTRLLISHRLNAVRLADRIHVLEDGRIVEHGSHDELVRLGGRYAKMFTLQARGYRDDLPDGGHHGESGRE